MIRIQKDPASGSFQIIGGEKENTPPQDSAQILQSMKDAWAIFGSSIPQDALAKLTGFVSPKDIASQLAEVIYGSSISQIADAFSKNTLNREFFEFSHSAMAFQARRRGKERAEWDSFMEEIHPSWEEVSKRVYDEIERESYADHYAAIMDRKSANRLAGKPLEKQYKEMLQKILPKQKKRRDVGCQARILNEYRERIANGDNPRLIASKIACKEGRTAQYVRKVIRSFREEKRT
jgi:hypothetical protein